MTSAYLPDARERPLAAGMAWAAGTFVLMIAFGWLSGHPATPRQVVAMALLAPVGGLVWGFVMYGVLNWLVPAPTGDR